MIGNSPEISNFNRSYLDRTIGSSGWKLGSHGGHSSPICWSPWCFQLSQMVLKFWEAALKPLIGRFSIRVWSCIWCLMSNYILWLPVINCWPNLENFPNVLYTLKLPMGFQEQLAHLRSSWVVSKATSISWHLAEQGFNTWHKSTTMWKTSWGLSLWDTHDNPTTSKSHVMLSRQFFLLKSGTFCIL